MKTCYVAIRMGVRSTIINGIQIEVNYDQIYFNVVKPIIESLGFVCKRGDELSHHGVIHKSIFSAILKSDIMVIDVGGGNGNNMYELGMRHACRSGVTLSMYCVGTLIPYDVANILAVPYELTDGVLIDRLAKNFESDLSKAILSRTETSENDSPLFDFFPQFHLIKPKPPCVFIGHGRSSLWALVEKYLKEKNLATINFESQARAGESVVPILQDMLAQSTFAVLILTAEDELADGQKRARQNVIHEAGLFQGVLGFKKAIVLKQDGVEDFSNIAGLQYISFSENNIRQTFDELGATLKREGLIK